MFLNFFYELKKAKVPASLKEYLTLLEAMKENIAEYNVEKLIFLGSSCIYPKESKQPIKEDELLSKPLEQTNEGYAIAKIAGLKLCSYFFKEHNQQHWRANKSLVRYQTT